MKNKKISNQPLVQLAGLTAAVQDLQILKDIDLVIPAGQVHVLMGPNGSGKSSLVNAVMGDPRYKITQGKILFKGIDIAQMPINERARAGMHLVMQHPIIIPGLTVYDLLKEAMRARDPQNFSLLDFSMALEEAADLLKINKAWLTRPFDKGFSGGQIKRLELLQVFILKPELAMLDEIDSGVDIDAVEQIGHCLAIYRKRNPSCSLLIITHHGLLLESCDHAHVHIMANGSLVHSGDLSVLSVINSRGYDAFFVP